MEVLAYAKLNLSLRVVSRREDGYHELQSLVTAIDLADRITLSPVDHGVQLVAPAGLGPPERNLALRAARAALPEDGPGVRISLEKRIPSGAGLGGGSSDAAAVLAGLNDLLSLGKSLGDLREIGAGLGADVPFFLGPSPAWVEGIGDQIIPAAATLPSAFLILVPRFRCPTLEVYRAFDSLCLPFSPPVQRPTAEPSRMPGDSDQRTLAGVGHEFGPDRPRSEGASARSASLRWEFGSGSHTIVNDLWPAAVHLFPELQELRDGLAAVAPGVIGMTGSGSGLFAAFSSRAEAEASGEKLRRDVDGRVFVASPIPWGYRIQR